MSPASYRAAPPRADLAAGTAYVRGGDDTKPPQTPPAGEVPRFLRGEPESLPYVGRNQIEIVAMGVDEMTNERAARINREPPISHGIEGSFDEFRAQPSSLKLRIDPGVIKRPVVRGDRIVREPSEFTVDANLEPRQLLVLGDLNHALSQSHRASRERNDHPTHERVSPRN